MPYVFRLRTSTFIETWTGSSSHFNWQGSFACGLVSSRLDPSFILFPRVLTHVNLVVLRWSLVDIVHFYRPKYLKLTFLICSFLSSSSEFYFTSSFYLLVIKGLTYTHAHRVEHQPFAQTLSHPNHFLEAMGKTGQTTLKWCFPQDESNWLCN